VRYVQFFRSRFTGLHFRLILVKSVVLRRLGDLPFRGVIVRLRGLQNHTPNHSGVPLPTFQNRTLESDS